MNKMFSKILGGLLLRLSSDGSSAVRVLDVVSKIFSNFEQKNANESPLCCVSASFVSSVASFFLTPRKELIPMSNQKLIRTLINLIIQVMRTHHASCYAIIRENNLKIIDEAQIVLLFWTQRKLNGI